MGAGRVTEESWVVGGAGGHTGRGRSKGGAQAGSQRKVGDVSRGGRRNGDGRGCKGGGQLLHGFFSSGGA